MSPDPQHPIVVHPPITGEVSAAWPEVPAAPVVTVRDTAPPAEPADAPPPPENAAAGTKRAFSLDALRGLFLISMTLGFSLHATDLPPWMYHHQQPPPDYPVVPNPGISWRDLAYGAFLFTMAAALPLTLSRRVAKADTELAIIFASIKRFLLLLFYALMIGHANTFFTGYTQTTRALAIAGFFILALIFTRRRPDWNESRYRVLNRLGWGLGFAFLAFSPLLYGKTFAFTRIDDVISGLAFAALAGSIIWYFTRDNLAARFGVLGFVVALYLGSREDGWVQQWWYTSPIRWAFEPSRLALLLIVIPGTIVGDVLLRWMRATEPAATDQWGNSRMAGLALLGAAFTPLVTAGLYSRAVLTTTQLTVALVIGGLFLTMRPGASVERMLRSLFIWGALFLVLGLLTEPFEGGIKKAPATLSYFLTIAGLSTMLLVTLGALVDGLGRRRWVATLIDVGHNPLMMYVVLSLLITGVLEMIVPLRGVLRDSPATSFLRSALETTLAVLIVRYFSRRRIYWRT